MLKKIISIILIIASIGGFIEFFRNFSFIDLLLATVFLVTGILVLKKSKVKEASKNSLSMKNNENQKYSPSITVSVASKTHSDLEKENHIFFNVAGISKKNDKGNDIQKLIKDFVKQQIEMDDYPYEGMTNKEILESRLDEVYEANISGYSEISFEPEPDNPYDSNAIKGIHEEIGHVGYIPRDMTRKVFNAISNDYEIEWRLVGGKYKYVDIDEYGEEKIRTKTLNYGIIIDLYY